MYQKPKLERFGTFRELTRLGPDFGNDFTSIFGPAVPGPVGCTEGGGEGFGCGRS